MLFLTQPKKFLKQMPSFENILKVQTAKDPIIEPVIMFRRKHWKKLYLPPT